MQAVVSRQIAQRRSANAAAVRTKCCVLQTFCKRGGQPSLSAAQSRRACRRCVRFGRRKRSFGKRRRFCLWTSPPAKVRKERLSQKDKSGAAGPERLRQGPAQTAAGRNGAFFAAGGAQGPRSLSYPFYAKSPRGPSYPSRAILCAIKKDAGRTARQPRRTEKRRQKRAGRKRLPVGDRFGGTHTPDGGNRRIGRVFPAQPRQSDALQGRASDRKNGRFPPPCGLSKKTHSPNPCAGAVLPAFCERRIAKETKPAPAASEAGSASPQTRARGEVPRRRASRRAENPRRYLRLAGGPLVLQQLQRTFFVLVFLYFDYACTQSPAHCAAEKTGRTIFS